MKISPHSARRLLRSAALVALLAGSFAVAHDDHGSPMYGQPSAKDQKRVGELTRMVRDVTIRYRDVEVAQADGYQLMFGCVSGSEWGAMGLHYVNMQLVVDGKLDAARPE